MKLCMRAIVMPLFSLYNYRYDFDNRLNDNSVIKLLQDMECLNLIRVHSTAENYAAPESKLSERFAGSLHLSAETYEAFQKILQEGRNEWARDIC